MPSSWPVPDCTVWAFTTELPNGLRSRRCVLRSARVPWELKHAWATRRLCKSCKGCITQRLTLLSPPSERCFAGSAGVARCQSPDMPGLKVEGWRCWALWLVSTANRSFAITPAQLWKRPKSWGLVWRRSSWPKAPGRFWTLFRKKPRSPIQIDCSKGIWDRLFVMGDWLFSIVREDFMRNGPSPVAKRP